jgi:hypothetical protein
MWMWRIICTLIEMGIKVLVHIILAGLLIVLFPIVTTWYIYVALNLLIGELIRGYGFRKKLLNNDKKRIQKTQSQQNG